MKCLSDLASQTNKPRLVSTDKQPERRLLSVFMALLEVSPTIRGAFFDLCGYRSARTSTYQSFMEVSFRGSKYPEVRPDGLVACQRGKSCWSAFIEAKAEKKTIRSDQIQDYVTLAELAEVDAIITLSNEFSRIPQELPYSIAPKFRKSRPIYHFAWADIRTFLELMRGDDDLDEVTLRVLEQCLEFFWDEKSGITTYDIMPEAWPAFVEAASTALGFNANFKGVNDIVNGWQQERRDLGSKITHLLGFPVELRHVAGVRLSEEDRFKADKKGLANDYVLTAQYYVKAKKLSLDLHADLRACRVTGAMDVPMPDGKGARAIVTWLTRTLADIDTEGLSISFDWPGRNNDVLMPVSDFLAEPAPLAEGKKDAPKSVRLLRSSHGVRNFKSRKKFIIDVETIAIDLMRLGMDRGWI